MALPSKELSEPALDGLILREQTRVVAPLTEWQTLSMSLRQEGLIHDAAGARQSARREYTAEPVPPAPSWLRSTGRWTRRVATGAALLGVGVLAGRGMTFGQGFLTQWQAMVGDSTSASSAVHVGGKPFASPADARKTLLSAQTDYERAAAFLAASDSSPRIVGEPDLYRDRLAGLDEMTAASLNALKGAPQDPLLNQYFLSATAAREATILQLGHALPAGATMERF